MMYSSSWTRYTLYTVQSTLQSL